MFLDLQNLFSDKQTIAAAAGTVVSTNSLDTWVKQTPASGGPLLHDIARGNVPELLAQITESVTSAGAATVDIQFVQSANADLSTPTVLLSTGAIAKTTLVAGYQIRYRLPRTITARYIGFNYVIGTATTTAGKVTAGFVTNIPTAAGSSM